MSVDLEPAGKFMWEKIIRRVELEPAEMLIALVLSTYASEDGSSVRPGLRKLINVTPYSRATVCRSLSRLRDIGLIEYVFKATSGGRRNVVDEYRLTIPWNLPDIVTMLDPDENPAPDIPDHISPVRPGRQDGLGLMDEQPGLTHETGVVSPMRPPSSSNQPSTPTRPPKLQLLT